MLCLIRYRIGDGPEQVKLYTSNSDLVVDQFNPCYEIINAVNFGLRGTYKEKQIQARGIAARIRSVDDGTLTHNQYMIIAQRLQRIARRTGTIKIFREAGLIP